MHLMHTSPRPGWHFIWRKILFALKEPAPDTPQNCVPACCDKSPAGKQVLPIIESLSVCLCVAQPLEQTWLTQNRIMAHEKRDRREDSDRFLFVDIRVFEGGIWNADRIIKGYLGWEEGMDQSARFYINVQYDRQDSYCLGLFSVT